MFATQALLGSIQYSVYSHLFSQIMLNYNNGKTKEQRKSNYMCTRYYFEIVRSGQRCEKTRNNLQYAR